MQDIASVSLSIEESYEPTKISNYKTLNEFSVLINSVLSVDDLKTMLNLIDDNTNILVMDVKAVEKAAGYLKEENLQLIKNYIKVLIYDSFAEYTTTSHDKAYIEFMKKVNGYNDYSTEKYRNTFSAEDFKI